MKKALLVVAAAGLAAFAQQKYKQNQVGKQMWQQVSDRPGENSVAASGTAN